MSWPNIRADNPRRGESHAPFVQGIPVRNSEADQRKSAKVGRLVWRPPQVEHAAGAVDKHRRDNLILVFLDQSARESEMLLVPVRRLGRVRTRDAHVM